MNVVVVYIHVGLSECETITIQQYLPTYAGKQELGAIVHPRNHVSRYNSLSKITQKSLHGSVASQATHGWPEEMIDGALQC